MEQNLDTKLSRVESTINVMKTNLRLPENEVIEKVAEATNLHTLANIYIQEEEPETKDGIWIQASPEDVSYDTVKIDADILIKGYWRYDQTQSYPTYSKGANELCAIGNKFYGVRNYSSDVQIWEYDFTTNPYTTQKIYETSNYEVYIAGGSWGIQPFTDGTYLYIPNGFANRQGGVYQFNPQTKDFSFILIDPGYDDMGSNCPYYNGGCYNAANDTIYVLGSWGGQMASYNRTTQEIKSVYSHYNGPAMKYAYPMGETLFCILDTKPYARVFNISTNKLTAVTSDLANEQMLSRANIIDMGNYWYAFDGLTRVLKINKTDFTYEDVTSDFNQGDVGEDITTVIHDLQHHFIAVTTNSDKQRRFVSMDTEMVNYDHNSIIIMQSPITKTEKQAALWTYPNLEGRMCQSFYDVYYYNKDTGFHFNLPTYYGDGTQWIKFKN